MAGQGQTAVSLRPGCRVCRQDGPRPVPGANGQGRAEHDYFRQRRAKVNGFVHRHFTWPGTLRLHGAAFGWDILRATVNVALAPVFVLLLGLIWASRRLGLHRLADGLASRPLLLRTDVARRVEGLLATDLLDLPMSGAVRDESALTRAVLSAPQLRDLVRSRDGVDEAQAMALRIRRALRDYTGTRSAVAEMVTALVTLVVGAVVFQALTPGMISMAPGVAEAVSRNAAISAFPLGQTLGGLWYGAFPVGVPFWLVAATVAGLVMLGSVVAAFAGILADPVQSRFGIHRRRLLRLIDTLEAEMCGPGNKPFTAREHVYVRVFDLWDVAVSLLRSLRG